MATETLNFDVAVVGSGLAGFAAAVQLRKRGKRCAVIAKTGGATSVSSGAWDFGPIPAEGPFGLESLRETPRWHALYQNLLVEAPELAIADDLISGAQDTAVALAKDLKISLSVKRAYLLPSMMGGWKRTFAAQDIQTRSDVSILKGRKVGFVTSRRWRLRGDLLVKRWVSAPEVADSRPDLHVVEIDLPAKGSDWPLPHVATRLLQDETLRKEFLTALEKRVADGHFDTLLFPPIFLDPQLAESWQRTLKVNIGEALAGHEPTAGFRLAAAVRASLTRLDIPVIPSSETRFVTSDGFVREIQVLDPVKGWREIKAPQLVLATGKFFGGGIDLGYPDVRERLLDLPIFLSRDSGAIRSRSEIPWGDQDFADEQPWAKLGVWADGKWRPQDEARQPALKNVFACGSLLGGVDFAREGLGLGFMAYSGRQVGNVVP